MQPLNQGTVGNLRCEAWQQVGPGASPRDLTEKLHELRRHRQPRELERPLQHGDVRVEPFRGQQRSTRGARHANDPLDVEAFGRDDSCQFPKLFAPGVVSRGKVVERAARVAAHPRQHLRNQPPS